jgi:hypothetical protein
MRLMKFVRLTVFIMVPGRLTVVLTQLATETRSTTHLTVATALLFKKNLSPSLKYKIIYGQKD